jgi:hypothetical protein
MGSSGEVSVPLKCRAGIPYRRRFRLVDGAAIWSTVESFEVRSQIRDKKDSSSELLGSLTPYLTKFIEGNDIVVQLEMTGAQTRTLPKKGYYDIIISDPGVEDDRAIPISSGRITVRSLITEAADV